MKKYNIFGHVDDTSFAELYDSLSEKALTSGNKVAYKGYLITATLYGEFIVTKDNTRIVTSKSEAAAKKSIDGLTESDMSFTVQKIKGGKGIRWFGSDRSKGSEANFTEPNEKNLQAYFKKMMGNSGKTFTLYLDPNAGFKEEYIKKASGMKEAGEATKLKCMECGKDFKKKLGKNTYEVKCPKCGSYDTEPA